MKKLTALAALAVFGLFSQTAHSAELLTNGSFESATGLNSAGYCYNGIGSAELDCGGLSGWGGNTSLSLQINATSIPWGIPGNLAGFDSTFGSQLAGIQNGTYHVSTLEQTVSGAGGLYTLNWYDAGRVDYETQTYEVRFGGVTLGTFGVNPGQGWSLHNVTFTAAAGSQLLSFVGVGTQVDGTAFLDKISLTSAAVSPVPEPESLAMMLAGLGVLGGVARRQRKAA